MVSSRSFDITADATTIEVVVTPKTLEVEAKITITDPVAKTEKLNPKVWDFLSKLEACVRDPFQEFGIELPRNEKSTSKGEVQSFELGKSRNEIRIGLGPT